VGRAADAAPDERHARMSRDLAAALPAAHLDFLRNLQRTHREGDYVFVHAGIRPGVALDDQEPDDLLWIREPFLDDDRDHGLVVVHGHTIAERPEVFDNRIGIDTGAFATGRLTCLVLEGADHRFLQT
jgi:serine/threonine protein phosphatase 1